MPELLRWVLGAFACYRLAQLLAIDDGPFQAFARLREWAGCGEIEGVRICTGLGCLLSCPYCLGVSMALLCAACCLWPHRGTDVLLAVLGLAGAQAFLQGPREAGE